MGAAYAHGPVSVAVGYLNARDPNVSFYGNTPNKGTSAADNLGSFGSASAAQSAPVYAGYASAKTTQIVGAGVSYTLGPAGLGFVVTNTRFESLGSSSGPNPLRYTGTAAFTTVEVNGNWHVTPAFLLGSSVNYTRRSSVKADGGARYSQLDLGADYSLSKRTDVYALAVAQRASGRDSLGQAAVASISGFSPSSTSNQFALRVSMRHKF